MKNKSKVLRKIILLMLIALIVISTACSKNAVNNGTISKDEDKKTEVSETTVKTAELSEKPNASESESKKIAVETTQSQNKASEAETTEKKAETEQSTSTEKETNNPSVIETADTQAYNGKKFVMAAYQPYYGNENHWYNWQYIGASSYGGADSYPDAILENGRRDIASVYYPMIGAYDSTDRDVLSYHIDVAKAMGIDAFQVDYYADLNADYKKTVDLLVELAEKKNFKISFLYEPKIHMQGWISHSSKSESKNAIVEDMVNLVKRYGDSKACVKYDDKTVIGIFGVSWLGLSGSDWSSILSKVRKAGCDAVLMGDNACGSSVEQSSALSSMFHWELYRDNLENADAKQAYSFCSQINGYVSTWAANKPSMRLPVGIAFPGFNDSKIWGWDLGKQRVIKITGKEFYEQSLNALLDAKDSLDWVLLATFNDWNEGTIIEPDRDSGYERAIMTQNFVEKFKDISSMDDGLMQRITEAYLAKKNVTKYK